MNDEPLTAYRLRATMQPMVGAPVNWNARAIIWSGNDRRYYLRRMVGRAYRLARCGHPRGWRYRLGLWLFRLTDDRDRTYSPSVRFWRRLLNTQADVAARLAWAETNRYWRMSERRRANAGGVV